MQIDDITSGCGCWEYVNRKILSVGNFNLFADQQ